MERPSKNTLIRYFRGECLPHETELVKLYLAMDADSEFVADCLKTSWLNDEENELLEISDAEKADFMERFYFRKNMLSQLQPQEVLSQHRRLLFRLPFLMKVAATVLIIGTSLFIYKRSYHAGNGELNTHLKEIQPAGEKALLTLANGAVISLSDTPAGALSPQDGVTVEKTREGEVAYRATDEKIKMPDAINTVVTPKGGHYRITLPDGTKVWLNAASSISYPLHFPKNERRVKMTGEVYFEVAKATQQSTAERIPFFVETNKQEVQVLGTHFNINAYADENVVKTTLVEGSVKVIAGNGKSALLQPGQQSVLAENIRIENVDLKQQLAWVNGDFIFSGETLESALRQVARWYDVEIECPAHLGKQRFNGMISRSQPITMIIEMIQLTKQAKVIVKERRLIVTD